jgi:hypothetical protein
MDFNRPIKIQTGTSTFLDINSLAGVRVGAAPLSGFKVESAAYSSVAAQGFVDKAALRDGATVTEAYLGTRTVDILVSVYGETMGDFWDKLDELTAAMQPMPLDFSADFGVRSLRFFQPSWEMAADFPGGIELDMRCRPAGLPTYNVGRRNSIGKETDGFSQPATLRFLAPNPKKFLTASKTLSTGTATHRGSATVYPVLSKTSCTAGDTVTFNWSGGGTSSTVKVTAIDNGTVSVDADTMEQTNCRVVHADTTGDFLIYPGTVTIGGNHTADAAITFTEAWL